MSWPYLPFVPAGGAMKALASSTPGDLRLCPPVVRVRYARTCTVVQASGVTVTYVHGVYNGRMAAGNYSIADVAALTDTPVRTVRFYIAEGLLPSPKKTGAAAGYDEAFVLRLRAVLKLKQGDLPLAVIGKTLDELDEAGLREIVERPLEAPSDSAGDYVRRVLQQSQAANAGGVATMSPAVASVSYLFEQYSRGSSTDTSGASMEAGRRDRSTWERIVLGPDVELHVRRPQSRASARRVERVIEFAEQVFGKGAP